jgi:LmbE family N-acetylglucosaminyl deacetylase
MSFEARLARGELIQEPIALVAAHPDDEILWLGTRLKYLRRLRLIHLTDGAPRDLQDAQRAGCSTWQEYARLRRIELYRALEVSGARLEQCLALDIADQQSAYHLVSLVARLAAHLTDVEFVLTHPYEHGHPDHDSTAFVVHSACAALEKAGAPTPHIVEFASYHAREGHLTCAAFWPDARTTQWAVAPKAEDSARKARALDCFVTQRHVIQRFTRMREGLRAAPTYDFSARAPPAAALYDTFGWEMTSTLWRACACAALRHLGFSGPL